jgi:hypothetical protein
VITLAGCSAEAGRQSEAALPSKRSGLLTVQPAVLDLGTVPQAGQKESAIELINPGTQAVRLAAVQSTCPCLVLEAPEEIPAGSKTTARVLLDLREEPRFTGNLGITVEGTTPRGKTAFVCEVRVRIVPAASAAGGGRE